MSTSSWEDLDSPAAPTELAAPLPPSPSAELANPLPSCDEQCTEACATHAPGCDGLCDHLDHSNACLLLRPTPAPPPDIALALYLAAYDGFSLDWEEAAEIVGSMAGAKRLWSELQAVGLVAEPYAVNGERANVVLQCAQTYDSITREKAIARFHAKRAPPAAPPAKVVKPRTVRRGCPPVLLGIPMDEKLTLAELWDYLGKVVAECERAGDKTAARQVREYRALVFAGPGRAL